MLTGHLRHARGNAQPAAGEMRKVFLTLVGVCIQVAAWTLRTYGYIACCSPRAETDPYANVRATSYPSILIASGVVLACWLNLIGLSMIHAFRERPSSLRAFVVANSRSMIGAFALGSAFVSLPIGLYAWMTRTGLDATGYGLMLFGPSLFGAAMALIAAKRHMTS